MAQGLSVEESGKGGAAIPRAVVQWQRTAFSLVLDRLDQAESVGAVSDLMRAVASLSHWLKVGISQARAVHVVSLFLEPVGRIQACDR